MFRSFSDSDILFLLIGAARYTLALALIGLIGGGILGGILTILRILPYRWLDRGLFWFSSLVQATPLLMMLFLSFFGLPLLGIPIEAWSAASIALILFTGVFLGEIWTSAIRAVPSGQWEAGKALGLSFLAIFHRIITPQAIRLAAPPSVGFCVQVIKGTALTSIIGFTELTKAGTALNNVTFRPFFVFAIVALLYFALCAPLSWLSHRLEAKLAQTGQRK